MNFGPRRVRNRSDGRRTDPRTERSVRTSVRGSRFGREILTGVDINGNGNRNVVTGTNQRHRRNHIHRWLTLGYRDTLQDLMT